MTTMWSGRGAGAIPTWELPDRARKAREFAGLDQGQLAEMLGVARSTIARLEQGRTTKIKRPLILAWAMATGVDLHWLQTGNPRPVDPDGGDLCAIRDSNPEPADKAKRAGRRGALRFVPTDSAAA